MKSLLLFLLLYCSSALPGQSGPGGFPDSWQGVWSGELQIFVDSGMVQAIPMELHILSPDTLPAGSYTWTIIYGEDREAGKRSYVLNTVDAEKGFYRIDEKNSIVMEGYYLAGTFYQFFEVQRVRLLTTTSLKEDKLTWEIAVTGTDPVSTTGGQLFDGEDIPQVLTYPVTNVQRAVLRRQ